MKFFSDVRAIVKRIGRTHQHESWALLLQLPMPDSSERGETGGKSATRISKFRKPPTSNRRPFHTLRESRSSRLSRATSRRTVMN